jgi:hypothetical protein
MRVPDANAAEARAPSELFAHASLPLDAGEMGWEARGERGRASAPAPERQHDRVAGVLARPVFVRVWKW